MSPPYLEMVASNEGLNLRTLPSSCLQLIVSHLDYHSVSKLRLVCKSFDVASKKVLNKGYKVLKQKVKGELQRAEEHGPVPSFQRTFFRKFHFLSNTYDVLRHCGKTYSYFVGEENNYFVAEKVLDEAYRLWDHFSCDTTLPFVKRYHLLLHYPHPLLTPFIRLAEKAYWQFEDDIVPAFLKVGENYPYTNFMLALVNGPRASLITSKLNRQCNIIGNAKKIKNRFEKNDKMISIGNETNRQFLNVILRLNEAVRDLCQETAKVDAKLANLMNQSNTFSSKSNCLLDTSTSSLIFYQKKPKETIKSFSDILDRKRPNLGTLPSNCLQHIFLNLNYEKVSQLRRVCKSFDESSKSVLNKGFEMLKAKVVIRNNHHENARRVLFCPTVYVNDRLIDENLVADLRILMLYCEDTYKWYMDGEFYFSAGKVLDEIREVNERYRYRTNFVDTKLNIQRPNTDLFPLTALIHKAINHFRDIFVPKYYPRKCSPRYTPEFATSGHVPAMNINLYKRNVLYIEKMEKKIKEQEKEIKKRNEKNRKFLKVISQLKKSLGLLNNKVSDKKKRLSELEQQRLILFLVKRNRKSTRMCKRKRSIELEQQWSTIIPVKRNRKYNQMCNSLNKI